MKNRTFKQILAVMIGIMLQPYGLPIADSQAGETTEWVWQNPSPQGNSLNGVWGTSEKSVYAVGGHGTIFHYDGESLTQMESGTDKTLHAIWGASENTIFAVGESGIVVHFDGETWKPMANGVEAWESFQHLYGIYGHSGEDIYAAGGGGTFYGLRLPIILHFDGKEWSQLNTGLTSINFYHTDLWCDSKGNAFILGYGVQQYIDSVWSDLEANWDGTKGTTNAIWGTSGNDLYLAGETGKIWHLQDGWWRTMPNDSTENLTCIWGLDKDHLFAAGEKGRVLKYDGLSWADMESPSSADIKDIWGAASGHLFAVGESGTFLHYDGSGWSALSSGFIHHLNDVWGVDSKTVYTVGDRGTILQYKEGVWTAMASGATENLKGIWGSAPDNIFSVGGSTTYDAQTYEYHSTYAILHYDGSAWTTMEMGASVDLNALWGSSANNIYAVGENGVILHYDGKAWSRVESPTTQELCAIGGSSATAIHACGEDLITFDGNTWTILEKPYDADVYYSKYHGIWASPDATLWAVGQETQYKKNAYGKSIRYTHGAWKRETLGDFFEWDAPGCTSWNDISGISATNIFIAGSYGYLAHYNGGHVAVLDSGTSKKLNGVWASPDGHVFVVGESGLILHSSHDYDPPQVVSTSPAGGSDTVPIDTSIEITFSETIDPATLTNVTFTLSDGNNGVEGEVHMTDRIASLKPLGALASSTTYIVTLSSNIKDVSGNTMLSNYIFSFTTQKGPSNGGGCFISSMHPRR
jgi:hypothetical protein